MAWLGIGTNVNAESCTRSKRLRPDQSMGCCATAVTRDFMCTKTEHARRRREVCSEAQRPDPYSKAGEIELKMEVVRLKRRKRAIAPGERFVRWTVLSESETRKNKSISYLCACTCGTERVVTACSLLDGSSNGCGCVRPNARKPEKLILLESQIYKIWRGVVSQHERRVDPRWRASFEEFWYDVGARPKNAVLRLKSNACGYYKWNTSWASKRLRSPISERTYRRVVKLLIAGNLRSVVAKRLGVGRGIIRNIERALDINFAQRFRQHGISKKQFDDMLHAQAGKCAIGSEQLTLRTAFVDHDHATGMVRGLLCPTCNSGLGMFGDSIPRLLSAISYLRKHSQMPTRLFARGELPRNKAA